MNSELVAQYKVKIEALFPLAKKAYGSRKQDTPAHRASREYTRLLVEFSSLGGNVPELARVLKVAYPGVRRRIIMEKVFISDIVQERTADKSELPNAIERIKTAKETGGSVFYHNQLTKEYIAKINTTGTKRDATFFLIAVYFNLPFSVFSSVISI
jgi:hypothetical protein